MMCEPTQMVVKNNVCVGGRMIKQRQQNVNLGESEK